MEEIVKLKQLYAENAALCSHASKINLADIEENVRKFADMSIPQIEAEYAKAQAGVKEKQLKANLLNALSGLLITQVHLDGQCAAFKAKGDENLVKVEGLRAKLSESKPKK